MARYLEFKGTYSDEDHEYELRYECDYWPGTKLDPPEYGDPINESFYIDGTKVTVDAVSAEVYEKLHKYAEEVGDSRY